MRKSILIATLLFAVSAGAQDTTYNFGGSLDVRYETDNNFDNSDNTYDKGEEYAQRTKLHMTAVKGENLSAKIALANVMLWGDTAAFASKDTSLKGVNTRSNVFQVEEAHGIYKISPEGSLQFGRGHYLLGQGELISKRMYEYTPVSFDGLLYLHELEAVRIGAFFVRGADNGYNTSEAGSTVDNTRDGGNFSGLTATFKNVPDFLNEVLVHYINAKADTMGGTTNIVKNERTWIGLSTTGETGMWDYHAAYIKFNGEVISNNIDRDGDMVHLSVGANMPEIKGLRIGLDFHQDSGDKTGSNADLKSETYDPLYNNYQKYAGRMEIVNWGTANSGAAGSLTGAGLTYLAAKVKFEPVDSIKVMLDYYMFTASEKQSNSDDEIGTEIDLTVEKSYANGFYANLTYGMFQFGDFVSTTADDATMLRADFGFDF